MDDVHYSGKLHSQIPTVVWSVLTRRISYAHYSDERIAFNPRYPRGIASKEQVLALKPELQLKE